MWTRLVATSSSEASFRMEQRLRWVADKAASSTSHVGRELSVPRWAENYIDEMRSGPEWARVIAECSSGPQLANR